mmetsp:Transcript_22058/g.32847  ORF Transcript_22058/g.32847 Transcript_22058/m.32847 type:complete len:869 (-) Transcript_22058:3744-6350(-)
MTNNAGDDVSFNDAEMVKAPEAPTRPTAAEFSSKDARTSFTADSPYYTSYVEQEMRQLQVLSETLRDISARAKTFGKCGALMAEATRRMALACRLKPSTVPGDEEEEARQDREDTIVSERREAVGDDMATVLFTLGEVLDEIANAQVQMCESLEASLSGSLEAFCGTQLNEVAFLKAESETTTDAAEQSISRYLNGRHAPDNGGDSWNKLSEQVGQQIGSTFGKWRSTSGGANDGGPSTNKYWRSGKGEETAASRVLRSSRSKSDADPNVVAATTAANLRLTLEQIRLAQTNAELKRFQLLKKLVSIKKRRNFELGESALASLHGIRAYFTHCSDLVQGLTPRMQRIQVAQNTHRDKHKAQQLPWATRERGLTGAMDAVAEAVAHANYLAEGIATGDLPPSQGQVPLEILEQETELWDLPALLAESSKYQREPATGVIVEGWLYKKSSSRMALQPWNKRWFMMDKSAIYYFRSSSESKKTGNGHLHTLERVKICDVVLCTVKEQSAEGLRFCFEIVTPNQKPLMLQARGPLEYRLWVDGIRGAITGSLMAGHVDSGELMQGIGKKKKKRGGDGVPEKTLASMLEAETVPNRNGEGYESTDEVETPTFREQDSGDDGELDRARAEVDLLRRPAKNPMVQEILTSNPICADCNAEDPDWASLNLGVLVCIQCSGVHRSLGVHVSKVRSLKLDSVTQSEAKLLLALGNERVNRIWEAGVALQQGWRKPDQSSTRQLKENWIKGKYQWKGFLEDRDTEGQTEEEKTASKNKALFEAAKKGDLLGIAEALAYGGDVDWKNSDEEGKTPLHMCSLVRRDEAEDSEFLGLECAELLLQNGAKMHILDDKTQSVLDCCVIGNGERDMLEYLSSRKF